MRRILYIIPVILISCGGSNENHSQIEEVETNIEENDDVVGSIDGNGPLYVPEGDFTPGYFDESTYINDYFGFNARDWRGLGDIRQIRTGKTSRKEQN